MKKPVGQQGLVKSYLNDHFSTKTQAEWEAIFQDIDCCWSTIRTLKTALTENGAPIEIDASQKRHLKNPIRFAQEPAQLSFDLPEFGEHTDDLKTGF